MNHSVNEPQRESGAVVLAGTAVDILVPGAGTEGAFSLLRFRNPPGSSTPPHRHGVEDETVYLLSGTMLVETDTGALLLRPGQAAVLRRGQSHRLSNPGAVDAGMLVLCTPGGLDRFIQAAGRSLAAADDLAVTAADIDRLTQAASRFGIELLGSDALPPAAQPAGHAPIEPNTLDVFGVGLQVLAELGASDDDVCLMRGWLSPNVVVPLHSHADREMFYVLNGTLDIFFGPVAQGSWRSVGRDGFVDVPGDVPHALRNRGDGPVEILLVATRRIAGFFREIGCPPGAASPGPPSAARMAAFLQASASRGYWLADGPENAAIGLMPD